MSAIAPPPAKPKPPLIFRIGVGILCLCTLVAMGVLGAQIKAAKIAARHGEKIGLQAPPAERPRLRVGTGTLDLDAYFSKVPALERVDVELDPAAPPARQIDVAQAAAAHGVDFRFRVADAGLTRLVVRRGERLRVEHLSLQLLDSGSLSVEDSKRRTLAEFQGLKKGQLRRWQEFQVTVAELAADTLTAEIELKPGAPSFGPGRYRARQGLQVALDGNRSVTISAWDPKQGGLGVRCEGPGQPIDRTIEADTEATVLSLKLRLLRNADGDGVLSIEEAQ